VPENIYVGSASADGPEHRGWLLGHFMPDGDLRQSPDVEIKWGVHPAGEERAEWVAQEERTSLHVLVSGRFLIRLPDREVLLEQPGDYLVMQGTSHTWRAPEASVVLSVRWPSLPGYAGPPPQVRPA
jgi:hypothetical protein